MRDNFTCMNNKNIFQLLLVQSDVIYYIIKH